MMNIWNEAYFKPGDKVMFLGTSYTIYNREGEEVHTELIVGKVYTVKLCGVLFVSLEEVGGSYLKEHFRRVESKL